MRIAIEAVEQSDCDVKGNVTVLGVRTKNGERHQLLLRMETTAALIGHCLSTALAAQGQRPTSETDTQSHDVPLNPDEVAAGIRPTGEADLVLRFGQVSLSVALPADMAAKLAQHLAIAVTPGPQGLQ